MVIRLRSNSATGFTNPQLQNLHAAYPHTISSTRDAVSANSELRIITEQHRIQFSDNDGVSYTDDYALATIPATQVSMMELQPGTNPMRYTNTGTPNAVLEISFNPPFS
jgi:hypothetical protein